MTQFTMPEGNWQPDEPPPPIIPTDPDEPDSPRYDDPPPPEFTDEPPPTTQTSDYGLRAIRVDADSTAR